MKEERFSSTIGKHVNYYEPLMLTVVSVSTGNGIQVIQQPLLPVDGMERSNYGKANDYMISYLSINHYLYPFLETPISINTVTPLLPNSYIISKYRICIAAFVSRSCAVSFISFADSTSAFVPMIWA